MMTTQQLSMGVIGLGYWGPNLARNFSYNRDLHLSAIGDFSKAVRQLLKVGLYYREVPFPNTPEEPIYPEICYD